eukprot:IDg15213t1
MAESNQSNGAAPTPNSEIKLKLRAKNDEVFEISKPEALCMKFVKGMLEDVAEQNGMEIPMPEVDGPILKKVVEYCRYFHIQETSHMTADEADRWEKDFVTVEKAMLFAMIRAANYLDIQSLLDLTCKTVADMIKGKTADEVNREFTIPPKTYLY